jgi:transposase
MEEQMLVDLVDHVIGVDLDLDRITLAVVCAKTQGELVSKVFDTTARLSRRPVLAETHTTAGRRAWAIEWSGSFGSGLASSLAEQGEFVIEFDHPTTRASKDGAKSDSAACSPST